jgi:hypothetical protein
MFRSDYLSGHCYHHRVTFLSIAANLYRSSRNILAPLSFFRREKVIFLRRGKSYEMRHVFWSKNI